MLKRRLGTQARTLDAITAAAAAIACACAGARLPAAESQPSAARPTAASPAPLGARSAPVQAATEDTSHTTASGVSFVVPAGWAVHAQGPLCRLDRPGAELTVAVVESNARNVDAAVTEAWTLLRPRTAHPAHSASDAVPREGWTFARDYVQESPAAEHRLVVAQALWQQAEGPFVVIAVDADRAAFDRRLSDIEQIYASVRPPGYRAESFAGKTANKLDATRVAELVDFVDRARRRAGIPGVALSLVQDDKPLFEGGLGVRQLGEKAAVGADTLFMIASTTKALTSLLVARLVDEGRFGWQTPVAEVYPAFALASPELTARVQMRHLGCACTGVPSQNLEWLFEFEHATPRSLMQLLSTMQPTTAFGETFQYSNVMAAAAGFVAGHALYPKRELGAAYDLAMRSRVFGPLSMTRTTFDFERALGRDHASPHELDVHGNLAVATLAMNRSVVPLRPSAGAWSSVRDLTRYLRFELAGGVLPDGRRHVSAGALAARYEPYVKVTGDASAGLGLGIEDRWGVKVISAGGIMPGFASHLVWLPEHGVGAALLTNSDDGLRLPPGFGRKLLELLFDGQHRAEAMLAADVDGYHQWVHHELARWSARPDPAVVAALAPRYHSSALGELEVRTSGEVTVFDFGGFQARVASRRDADGSAILALVEPGINGFEFTVAEREGKRALLVSDSQHQYVFLEATVATPSGRRGLHDDAR